MRPVFVVLDHPPPGGFPDVLQRREQVLVQYLFAIRAVKAFDVGILIWLARLDILDRHPHVLCPGRERLAKELHGPLVECW